MSRLADTVKAIERVILGKSLQVRLCLTCILARGHLLIEDVPGVGKTTLAHTLAQVLGLEWTRVQFTSDMLPADIIGVSIFDRTTNRFQFRRGPVFTQLLLADEVNRASPKAQSALLEAMEERQVSVDGTTYPLPEPFFVVATQNPHEQIGTFGLPESQLDRFLMRVSLGYPDPAAERREMMHLTPTVLNPQDLLALENAARRVHIAEPLLDYVQALVACSRAQLPLGLSPRAAQGLVRAAQAWAFLHEEPAVLPEHVQAVFPAIAAHRLESTGNDDGNGQSNADGRDIVHGIIQAVPIRI